ncbi:trimeric LpxA-like protein [Hyaloraphidium curvatum]|nr:trimeric LpxA-like protein [Hyaloraphidium curvatum]
MPSSLASATPPSNDAQQRVWTGAELVSSRPRPASVVLVRCGGAAATVVWELISGDYSNVISEGRAACWDSGKEIRSEFAGWKHLRTAVEVRAWVAALDPRPDVLDAFLGHGEPLVVGRMVDELERELAPGSMGDTRLRFPPAVASTVALAPTALIGRGAKINHYNRIGNGARVGEFCRIGNFCLVPHDCVLGNRTCLNAAVILGGWTNVGEDSVLGLRATVRDHLTVAAGTTVGMGAVVTRSIDVPGETWVGTPARKLEKQEAGKGGTGADASKGRL